MKYVVAILVFVAACAGEDGGSNLLPTGAGGAAGDEAGQGGAGGAAQMCGDYPDCPETTPGGLLAVLDDVSVYGYANYDSKACTGRRCAACRWTVTHDAFQWWLHPGGTDVGFENDYPRCRVANTNTYCTGYHTQEAVSTGTSTTYHLRPAQPDDDCN